jgi:HlyD family secretion protein
MKSNKKWFRLGIAAVVVVIIILVIAKRQGVIGKPEGVKVTTEEVTIKSITETVSANGKIQPEAEVKISPDVSGEVVELYVKEGDAVKAGALLAKIDP